MVHVAAWAARFLFANEDLNRPVGKLSGGERARVLIAQLMLQQADVLLLDEPTNDLDIPTLEILEERLLEYGGALVLVTHDRFMLDRVSTVVLGLDGIGNAEGFADYAQWNAWQRKQKTMGTSDAAASSRPSRTPAIETQPSASSRKLSYGEVRDLATIEERIAEAERELHERRAALEDPSLRNDVTRLRNIAVQMEQAQKTIENLYARWAELERKKG